MRTSSKRILAVVGVLVAVLAVYLVFRPPSKFDQDQILAQLETARSAAERHDANGILRVVSEHYNDGRFNNDSLAFFLRRVAKQGGPITVAVSTPSVQVQGDTADSVSQLTVRSRDSGQVEYDNPMTLHWKREDGTRWLVLPAKVWRVVSAEYSAPGQGDEGGGFF